MKIIIALQSMMAVMFLLSITPDVIRWFRGRYYRHGTKVNTMFVWIDTDTYKNDSGFVRFIINQIIGDAERHPWRKINEDVVAWLAENRISYWFEAKETCDACGWMRFRNETDLVHFKLRFSDLSVVGDA